MLTPFTTKYGDTTLLKGRIIYSDKEKTIPPVVPIGNRLLDYRHILTRGQVIHERSR